MKMEKIKSIVEISMLTDEKTRDDDFVLYASVCKHINPLFISMDMGTVLNNHERLGVPSFESVSRARRKVQEENPSLRPSRNASDARYRRWKEVKEWATQ